MALVVADVRRLLAVNFHARIQWRFCLCAVFCFRCAPEVHELRQPHGREWRFMSYHCLPVNIQLPAWSKVQTPVSVAVGSAAAGGAWRGFFKAR